MSHRLAAAIAVWGETSADDCQEYGHNHRSMNCSQALWNFLDKLFGTGNGFDYGGESDDEEE